MSCISARFTRKEPGRRAEKLDYLRDTGITVIEVMPVGGFPGKFGWGYDGVQPVCARCSIYGTPDDMRRFRGPRARAGIGRHSRCCLQPSGPGRQLPVASFRTDYFSEKHQTDWGAGINYDGEDCGPVREFFLANAAYWIREFHLDGLRLDATQDIHDDSEPHILAEITRGARQAAGQRDILLIGENEPQDTRLIRAARARAATASTRCGMTTITTRRWSRSPATRDAYYTDYRGSAQEFVSALKYGYLYQGQWYRWQKQRRGTSDFRHAAPRDGHVHPEP